MTIDCIILVTIRYIPILPPSEHWAYLASLDKELLRARELLLPQRHLIFVGRQNTPRPAASMYKPRKDRKGLRREHYFSRILRKSVVLGGAKYIYIYMHVYVHIVSV